MPRQRLLAGGCQESRYGMSSYQSQSLTVLYTKRVCKRENNNRDGSISNTVLKRKRIIITRIFNMSAYSLRLDASGSSFGLFGITKRVGQFVEDVATTLDDTIGHAFEEWQMDGSKGKGGGRGEEEYCGTPENTGCGRGAPDMSPVSSSQCSGSSSQGCVVVEEWGDFSIDDDDDGMASLWKEKNKEVSRLEKQMRELERENEELKADRMDEQTRHQIEKLVEEKSELKRENDRLVRENKSLSEMVAYLVACAGPSAMSPAPSGGGGDYVEYPSDCDDLGIREARGDDDSSIGEGREDDDGIREGRAPRGDDGCGRAERAVIPVSSKECQASVENNYFLLN